MFNNETNYLDQHFLIDEETIKYFIGICNLSKDDIVLEIGPGKGVLTKLIAPKVKKLYVIEKDVRLIDELKLINNVEVICDDAIKCEYPKINKIITSLPYSIIEPFIYKLINVEFNELYMIMGKKYIDSVINYEISNLSLLTNVFFDSIKYKDISKKCFYPMPRVMSGIIKLSHKKVYTKLEQVFKTIYLLNDKKTKNAIMESLIICNSITKKEAKSIICSLSLSDEILNKEFKLLSNNELKIVYEKLKDDLDLF